MTDFVKEVRTIDDLNYAQKIINSIEEVYLFIQNIFIFNDDIDLKL